MAWLHEGKEINTLGDAPDDVVGFVYKITNAKTGEYYIGKKNFFSRRTLPPLKGKKRKRKVVKEMKWQSYRSSNTDVKKWKDEDIELEILRFCKTKKGMTYYETKYQFDQNVLADDKCMNGNILGKFWRKDLELD